MLSVLSEAALRTLLLAAAVQLALWVLHVRRAQTLLAAWTVVLAASIVMPALQWATPLRLSIVQPNRFATWLIGVAELGQQAAPATIGFRSAGDTDTLQPATWPWWDFANLMVSSVMILRLVVGVGLSLRLLSKAVPTSMTAAPKPCVRISRMIAAPVTIGNVILLPPDALNWPPAMRLAVIAHECAHVARWDFALLALSQLNRALFWFSPVSWLLHRRLAALAELASDDYAMSVTGDRTGYAEVLLEMGRRSGPLLRGLAMAKPSTIPHRIERALSNPVGAAPISGVQQSLIVVGGAIVSIVVASPDIDLATPPGSIARERFETPLALEGISVPSTLQTAKAMPRPSPLPSPIEGTFRPFSSSATPLQQAARAVPQQPSVMPMRPVARTMVSNTRPSSSAHAQAHSQAMITKGDGVARRIVGALSFRSFSPGTIGDADHENTSGSASGLSLARVSQREGPLPVGEPSLLKAIDQQTCNGVFLPGAVGGAQSGSGWGYLNMVRAKFFREADGKPWLRFYLGTRDPVNLPVQVTGKDVEFTAGTNTSFKMLPEGTNHLTGTTQRPNGTIDFACGEGGAPLFNRKS